MSVQYSFFFWYIVPLTHFFYFSYNIWFLCSPNQNSSQNQSLPSLGQPNDISFQNSRWVDRNFLHSGDEYFTASRKNSLFYRIWGLREEQVFLWQKAMWRLWEPEEEEKVHFLHPKTPKCVYSLPTSLKPIHSYIQKFPEQRWGRGN